MMLIVIMIKAGSPTHILSSLSVAFSKLCCSVIFQKSFVSKFHPTGKQAFSIIFLLSNDESQKLNRTWVAASIQTEDSVSFEKSGMR